PYPNTPEEWTKMVTRYQAIADRTRLRIPLLYGADCVHGHNNLKGAVIFPHNVGLGATRDPELMERIGRVTALEMCATGVYWNFAPVIAVPQDIRWGRTYEGYGEETELVAILGAAYVRGLQTDGEESLGAPGTVLATPKHYIGDGGTVWGAASANKIDQGDVAVAEDELRRLYLPPYRAAIEAGALSIMVSYSSWRGVKMHAHRYLLTDVLKGELGFRGFLVSDFEAIQQIPGGFYSDVVTAVNAGLDMIMISRDYPGFISILTEAVEKGDVSRERIDDAVGRILYVKLKLGLFDRPPAETRGLPEVGSAAHRAVAREAVQKSLVLLKNENTLPLAADGQTILIAGRADDIGFQCGGWTIEWQGDTGAITQGTSILAGIRERLGTRSRLYFDETGEFADVTEKADIGIVVVGERPYAEGHGDELFPALTKTDRELVKAMRERCARLVMIIISGRPLEITDLVPRCDAIVAAWLPGSEGGGVADVLFGQVPFQGKLPYTWARDMRRLPVHSVGGDNPDVFYP
ncbi:MAG TPA: beta-glucosidase, partial [Spirochaetia bacterium]|nr:beta-glucosidase [Spirochaetia bacterium]